MRFYELMVIVDSDLEVPEGQDAPSLAKAIESIESDAYDKQVLVGIFRDLNNDTN